MINKNISHAKLFSAILILALAILPISYPSFALAGDTTDNEETYKEAHVAYTKFRNYEPHIRTISSLPEEETKKTKNKGLKFGSYHIAELFGKGKYDKGYLNILDLENGGYDLNKEAMYREFKTFLKWRSVYERKGKKIKRVTQVLSILDYPVVDTLYRFNHRTKESTISYLIDQQVKEGFCPGFMFGGDRAAGDVEFNIARGHVNLKRIKWTKYVSGDLHPSEIVEETGLRSAIHSLYYSPLNGTKYVTQYAGTEIDGIFSSATSAIAYGVLVGFTAMKGKDKYWLASVGLLIGMLKDLVDEIYEGSEGASAKYRYSTNCAIPVAQFDMKNKSEARRYFDIDGNCFEDIDIPRKHKDPIRITDDDGYLHISGLGAGNRGVRRDTDTYFTTGVNPCYISKPATSNKYH